ncbi:uncharacterized protein JCM6883_002904 [Sporobolomyces salmoneus]|uniref:uncharacterized protein n=1 Tax=Sporobolomyces salmoneus TaxID=183962 RepID=UPI00318292AE
MANPPESATLQPIIKRSLSPSGTISNSALKSPQFSPEPHSPKSTSPTPTSTNASTPSYFFQSHSSSTTPLSAAGLSGSGKESTTTTTSVVPPPTPGILLNKNDSSVTLIKERPHSPPPIPEPFLRVASPTESNSNRSDSGFSSSDGGISSPPPALGSPVQTPSTAVKPALESLVTSTAVGPRGTSPPSPHCHFAPLPKPEERPQSRRSSIVSGRVKPFIPRPPERSDTMSTSGGGDDEALSTGEYTPSLSPTGHHSSVFTPTSSSEHFSALSQRLSSSLTFAAPTARHPSSPSRPTSRRSSSSRRSRSPSPPGGLSLGRSSSSDHHAAAVHHRDRSHGSSRTHSPNLSRRPSTDALSLHYIEAQGGVSLSRQNSRAGSERGGAFEEGLMMSTGSGSGGVPGVRRPQSSERRSTFDLSNSVSGSVAATPPPLASAPSTSSATPTIGSSTTIGHATTTVGSGAMLIDKDKEADLHRLLEKAQHGNLDAERAVSPALQAQREREKSRDREREEVQVVEVGRGEEKTDELEEVQEEEEEEEENEDDEDEEEEDDNDNSDENEDEEEEEEPDQSRDDEEDDEDEEEEPAEERKTSKGAAVEVVRWHRDDPPPSASTPVQADPTPSIPEDSIAEQEAEEQSAVESHK